MLRLLPPAATATAGPTATAPAIRPMTRPLRLRCILPLLLVSVCLRPGQAYRWPQASASVQVFQDPPRIADRLAVHDQDRNAPLPGERLDLGTAGAAHRHDHLLEVDSLSPQGPRHLSAGTEPVRGGGAAIQRGHMQTIDRLGRVARSCRWRS